MSARKVLDGGATNPSLTGEFNVTKSPAMIYGINLSSDVKLEVKCEAVWVPVVKEGAAVVLSNAADNPLGIYANGDYRLVAGALAADEVVYVNQ